MPTGRNGQRSAFDIPADYWTRPVRQARSSQGLDQEQPRTLFEEMNSELYDRLRSLERQVTENQMVRQEDEERHRTPLKTSNQICPESDGKETKLVKKLTDCEES